MMSLLASPLDSFRCIHDPFWPRPLHEIVATRPSKRDVWSLIGSDLLQDGLGELPTLQDKDGKYVIQVATPGVKQQNLTVELVGRRQLVISAGKPKTTNSEKDGTVEAGAAAQDDNNANNDSEKQQVAHRNEAAVESTLSLRKAVNLPQDVNIDAISLSYADGMLTIEAPKRTKSEAEEQDEETAAIESELKRKRERMEAVRRELAEERSAVLEAESKLREARAAKRRRIASERRRIAIPHPSQPHSIDQ